MTAELFPGLRSMTSSAGLGRTGPRPEGWNPQIACPRSGAQRTTCSKNFEDWSNGRRKKVHLDQTWPRKIKSKASYVVFDIACQGVAVGEYLATGVTDIPPHHHQHQRTQEIKLL